SATARHQRPLVKSAAAPHSGRESHQRDFDVAASTSFCSRHTCPCRPHCAACTKPCFSSKVCPDGFGFQHHSIVKRFPSLRHPHSPNERSSAQSDQNEDRPAVVAYDLPSRMECSLAAACLP